MTTTHQENEVIATAENLREYFDNNPQSFETPERMAQWWLEQQPFESSLEVVQQALDYLESQGEVTKTNLQGGRMIYRKTVQKH